MKNRIKLFALFCYFSVGISAQKFMVVGQRGGVTTRFPMENVDSVYFEGYDEQNYDEDIVSFSDKLISSISIDNSCENFCIDGQDVYAVGNFGIYKYDYSIPTVPVKLAENKIDASLIAKSVTKKGDYLYVTLRQNTGGTTELFKPYLRFDFESNIKEFVDVNNGPICNDSRLNSFFKSLRIVSIDPSIINKIIVYKANSVNGGYRNNILIAKAGGASINFATATYNTKEEALNALVSQYTDGKGNSCEVNWDALSEGSTSNADFKLNIANLGSFDSYIQEGTASIDECGIQSPNRWCHSARLMNDSGIEGYAALTKSLSSPASEAFNTFWINADNVLSDTLYIPLLKDGEHDILSVICAPKDDSHYILGIKVYDRAFISSSQLLYKEWYNIKTQLSASVVNLWYSEKEMVQYENIISQNISNNTFFDKVVIGINTKSENALVYIDDYYYNPTEISAVSYVNGGIAVLDSKDLTLKKIIHSDLKATQSFILGNYLLVNYLTGFNIYDISDENSPSLVYYSRTPSLKEFQGCTYFEKDNHVYAVLSNYALGFTIWDITDPSNTFLVKEYSFDKNDKWGYYNDAVKVRLWEAYVDYPYIYFAAAPNVNIVGTDGDFRGIVTFDISNIEDISYTYSPIPEKYGWSLMSNSDRQPTHIVNYGKYLLLNNEEKGFAVFDASNKSFPTFKENVEVNGRSCVNSIQASSEGILIVGDGSSGSPAYPDKNIYYYKLSK